jgi:hypothetical protein
MRYFWKTALAGAPASRFGGLFDPYFGCRDKKDKCFLPSLGAQGGIREASDSLTTHQRE